jgi:hypothetical protein
MCLLIASVLLVFSYTLLSAGKLYGAWAAFGGGVLFLLLMGKNDVKKRKKSEKK